MLIEAVDNKSTSRNVYIYKAEYEINEPAASVNDGKAVEAVKGVKAVDRAGDISESNTEQSKQLAEPHDEYIPSTDGSDTKTGIYRLETDKTGKQTIVFDSPIKADKNEMTDVPEAKMDQNKNTRKADTVNRTVKNEGNKKGVKTTVNTDEVDAEIKKLKTEKQQLEQQIKTTQDDEGKRKNLEKQLAQVEAELRAKDNDAYRKQHATYTNG